MKYFILCALEQPQPGEWCEGAEFLLSEEEKDVNEEFTNAIVDGEYPYICTGTVSAEGIARIEVVHHE